MLFRSFKAIDVAIIDSGSSSISNLLDFSVNSNQRLLLTKDGALAINSSTIQGGLTVTGLSTQTNTIYAENTWNSGSTIFTGIKLSITDTSSSASSLLLDLGVGGVSKFSVDKFGTIYAAGNLTVEGSVTFNGDGNFEDSIILQTQANGAGL